MKMNRLVGLVAVGSLLSGCGPGLLGNGHSNVSTRSVGPALDYCLKEPRPDKAIHIEITKLDIRNIQAAIQELKTTDNYPHGDLNQHTPPPTPENASTPLSINLALKKNVTTTSKRDRIYIVVTIDDPDVTFYDKTLAITSLEPNGKTMFCSRATDDFGDKEAAFLAKYYDKDSGNGKHTHGTFNINLKVPQAGGGFLPVSIDPDVQNDG